VRPLTSDFFLWLLDYEFADTIMLITKAKVIFAVSQKKKELLEKMEVPADYDGPKLEIVLRTLKPVDNTDDVISSVLSNLKHTKAGKIAIYQKDQPDGDITEKTLKAVTQAGLTIGDMKELMDKVHMVKIESEIENMRVAAKFLKWTFDNVVNEIEDIVEVEKKIKHSQISNKVEKMLERDETIKKFLS